MKFLKYALITILFLISNIYGQERPNSVGLGISHLLPTGSLSYRFKPAVGINLFYGFSSSEEWEWRGNFEYLNFNKENRDRMKLRRNVNLGGTELYKVFDLPKLETDLKIFGFSVNGFSDLFDFNFLKSSLNFGFGIYRWESFRSEYFDTLRVEMNGINYDAVILKVPSLKQLDWSGGFNVGLQLSSRIIEPIWLELTTNYKAIIGELWATLDLDLDNISVFQMYEVKLSLKAKF